MSFLSDFENTIVNNFSTVVAPASAAVLDIFRPAFIGAYGCWVMAIGYEVAMGKTEDGMSYILSKLGKMLVVGTIALYMWPSIAELMEVLRDGLVAGLGGTTTISGVLETQLLRPLEIIYSALVDATADVFSLSGALGGSFIFKLFGVVVGFILFGLLCLIVTAVAIVCLAMYLVSLACFQLLMAVGPLFLLCLAFPVTQRFFEVWVGACFTSSLAMGFTALMAVFTAAVLNLTGLGAALQAAGGVDFTTDAMFTRLASQIGFCALLIYMYQKVFDLASALGGGMNMGNNMMGAVRAIARDMARGSGGQGRAQPGHGGSINQGGGGAGSGSSSSRQQSPQMAALRNSTTFTGAAIRAGAMAATGVSQFAYRRVASVARAGASAAGTRTRSSQ